MNTLDIILAIILAVGLVRGFFRGILAEVASIIGLIAGIFGAIHFSYIASDVLLKYVDWEMDYVNIVAFAITFIAIVIIVAIIGKVLTKIAGLAALGLVNKFLGAAFGTIKVAFLISLFIMLVNATDKNIGLLDKENLENSILYTPIQALAPALLPSILEEARKREILTTPETKKES